MEFLFWVAVWGSSGVLMMGFLSAVLWLCGVDVEKLLLNIAAWLEGSR